MKYEYTDYEQLKKEFSYLPSDDKIVAAAFWGGGYEESVWILFRVGDKYSLYQDGHCSCNGFDGAERFEDLAPVTAVQLRSGVYATPWFGDKLYKDTIKDLE